MFKVLVAQKLDGRFQKVAVIAPRNDGTFARPAKMQGQLSGVVTKNAIAFFMAESAATQQDVVIGSHEFRITRFN